MRTSILCELRTYTKTPPHILVDDFLRVHNIKVQMLAWRMTSVLCSGAFVNLMSAENSHKSASAYPHILVDDFLQAQDIRSELVVWTKTNVERRCVQQSYIG